MAGRLRVGSTGCRRLVNPFALIRRPSFLPSFTRWPELRDKRIAMTGHRGTLGALLYSRLLAGRNTPKTYQGDVTDANALGAWIARVQPDLFFHLAAIVPVTRVQAEPVAAMRVNAVASLGLVEALACYAPGAWLFHASSSHVYSPQPLSRSAPRRLTEEAPCTPASLYGATKLAGECIVRPLTTQLGLYACIGRIFSFFHAQQAGTFLIPALCQRIAQATVGSKLEVYDATSVRDLLPAECVIDAILYLAVARHVGTVNIGSGRGLAVGAIATRLVRLAHKQITVQGVTAPHPGTLVADVRRLRTVIDEVVGH